MTSDDTSRPLIWGVGAALLGGGIWALIVGLTDTEVGWVAWGIGGLVGFAMSKATPVRSTGLAATAAGLAVLGLLSGKILIQVVVIGPAIEAQLRSEPTATPVAATWDLRERRGFPPDVQTQLEALGETDTIPDALWASMLEAGQTHADTLSNEERERLSANFVAVGRSQMSSWRQLGWSFSVWDLLWMGLAVSTAWRMMRAPTEKEAAERPSP